MTKGSKRRPGKGYDVNYDKIFKKEKPNGTKQDRTKTRKESNQTNNR